MDNNAGRCDNFFLILMIINCEIKAFCKNCAKGSIGKKKMAMAQNTKGGGGRERETEEEEKM